MYQFQQELIPVVKFVPSSTSTAPPTSSFNPPPPIVPELLPSVKSQIFCKFGPSCPNYDNCPNIHPCRYGPNCRKSSRLLHNNHSSTDLLHCKKNFHICPKGKYCKMLKNEEHTKMFIHECSSSTSQQHSHLQHSNEHKMKFLRHECSYGEKCRSLNDDSNNNWNNWEHYMKFIHPLNDVVKKRISEKFHYLFSNSILNSTTLTNSTNSTNSNSILNSTNSKISNNLKNSNTLSSCNDLLQKSDICGLSIVSKSTLIPQVSSRNRSAKFKIESINGKPESDYYFIGYQKMNGNMTGGDVICYKKTGKGVFEGHIKKVPETNCVFAPKGEIYQPWYHHKVTVYRNSVISQVFDEILNQRLNGVTPSARYIDVMDRMIKKEKIPVFIVGGAVRDVIREVIGDKQSNAKQIMKNIKDIDIGFGCDPHTFHSRLSSKYTQGINTPGIRGLVQIGSSFQNSTLFLEGKAINGLNNDNKSVNTDIPQCYGTDLRSENICRDFTCNSLWYDPINKCVLDTFGNGQGIKDALSKTLRIPVKESHWKYWADGNPTKMMRFYKFLLKGYTPVDKKTRQFIIDQTKKYSDKELEIRVQYMKGIGIQNRQKLITLLKNDFGDAFFNSFFSKHIQ